MNVHSVKLVCFLTMSIGMAIATPETVAESQPIIVAANGKIQELWNDGEFTEGVAVASDGMIFFSDIAISGKGPGRILKFNPVSKKTTVYSKNSGQSNGLMFNREGKLIAACGAAGGLRAICEALPDGKMKPLVNKFLGKVFNSPNDLVIHPSGDIYFTDPRYVGSESLELDHLSVYRFIPETGNVQRVTTTVSKPNGIVCSPDGKTVYIASTDNGQEGLEKSPIARRSPSMKLYKFRRDSNGLLIAPREFADFGDEPGVDGMTVDNNGRIYAARHNEKKPGIQVFDPNGKEVAFIKTPQVPTNCCFGRGQQASTLFITAGTGLYSVQLNTKGFYPATASWK